MTHGVGVLLLSAVSGYWVLERASKHKGGLQKVGQVIGTVVIVVSLLGTVCKIWSAATCPPGPGCPKKSFMCPFSGKPSPSSPAEQPQ